MSNYQLQITNYKSRIATSLLAILAVAALFAAPAFSWVPQLTTERGSAGTPQLTHWDFSAFPVQWNLNPSTGSNISGPRPVADVIQAAFSTWNSAPNASINVTRGADSNATSGGFNSGTANTNLICFVCQGDFSKDASTLAVTVTTMEDSPGGPNGHGGNSRFVGQILDADMLFNPIDAFSTGSGGTGEDLQSIATHESGHFLGLDHSPVVRATMFPFASPAQSVLSYDDVAGISVLYPKNGQDVATGSISGSVSFNGSGPVFGAHVFAQSVTGNDPFGGRLRKTPIGTLTLPDGTYAIRGVPADSYIVIAEPLDGPATNGDIASYAPSFGQPAVQTAFTTRWH